MLTVTADIIIPETELEERFIRSSGPGGQNVNKVATAVQLRFDVLRSAALPEEVRDRVLHIARGRITDEGVLIIEARRHREQERNRRDARERLLAILRRALLPPTVRKSSRRTRASVLARLDAKRRRASVKRSRSDRGERE